MTHDFWRAARNERPREFAGGGLFSGGAARRGRSPLRRLSAAVLSVLFAALSASAQSFAPGEAFEPGDGPSEPVKAVAVQADGKVLVGGAFQYAGGHFGLARHQTNGALDASFNASADGTVFALRVQADGRVLVGGAFQHVNGRLRVGLARLNAEGTLDEGFDARLNGTVFSVAEQPDGRIVVGGWFSQAGGRTRICVARLNADGSLDESFDPGYGPDSFVFAVALQPSGHVVIGGNFNWVAGQRRAHLARLSPGGALDPGFNPGADRPVRALAVNSDGRVLVGGDFISIAGRSSSHLARLDADGSPDDAFRNRGTNGPVRTVAQLSDGRVLVGGEFTQTDAQSRGRLARLNHDGTADASFADARSDAPVNSVAAYADGRVVAGGEFTEMGGRLRRHLARLRADGTLDAVGPLDESFLLTPRVYAFYNTALLPDGKILASIMLAEPDGYSFTDLIRLNQDGSHDLAFGVDTRGGPVLSMAVQPDGRVVIGGMFEEVNGRPRGRLARINADGSLDESFVADTGYYDQYVRSVVVQPDGRILVAGDFSTVNGQPRVGVARLNADGSLDPTFVPGVTYPFVYSIALQADGKVLACGYLSDGEQRLFARLNADGSLDNGFSPGPDSTVFALRVQPDGRILVGGHFSHIGGQPRSRFARLNPDGTADLSFNPGADDFVGAIALQTDGRILVGGRFKQIGGAQRRNLALLKSDGALDETFDAKVVGDAAGNSRVTHILLQADGRILAGGQFTGIAGHTRSVLARLYNTDTARQTLAINGSGTGIVWARRGSGPEVASVTFEVSEDGHNYTRVGSGSFGEGAWRIDNLDLPRGGAVFVRARGHFNSAGSNNSGSAIESVRALFVPAAQP